MRKTVVQVDPGTRHKDRHQHLVKEGIEAAGDLKLESWGGALRLILCTDPLDRDADWAFGD